MKKLVMIAASVLFSIGVMAQGIQDRDKNKQYCAKLQGSRMVVLFDGRQLTIDVTLEDGSKIRTDGTLLRKDGTKIWLEEGECVDGKGNLIEPTNKKKE